MRSFSDFSMAKWISQIEFDIRPASKLKISRTDFSMWGGIPLDSLRKSFSFKVAVIKLTLIERVAFATVLKSVFKEDSSSGDFLLRFGGFTIQSKTFSFSSTSFGKQNHLFIADSFLPGMLSGI